MKLAGFDVTEALKVIVALSGTFLACAYVAGRIYLQSYFSVFELDPAVLDFAPQEIAFQSRSVWLPILAMVVLVPTGLSWRIAAGAQRTILVALAVILVLVAARNLVDLVIYESSDWRAIVGSNLNILPTAVAVAALLAVLPLGLLQRAGLSWLLAPLLLFVLVLPAAAGFGRGLENRYGHPVGSFRSVTLTSDSRLLPDWIEEQHGSYVSPDYYLLGVSASYVAVWHMEEEASIVIKADRLRTIRHD